MDVSSFLEAAVVRLHFGRSDLRRPSESNGVLTARHRSASSSRGSVTAGNPLPIAAGRGTHNPVLTGADVTDYGTVDYVADPFIVSDGGRWHMFMEVFNRDRTPTGVIGHAASNDGVTWMYDRVVLSEEYHLSFPYVFRWNDRYYMLPEQGRPPGIATVELYEAESFPTRWRAVAELITPEHATHDHVAFRYGGRWWLFVGDTHADAIFAYFSDCLVTDDWSPHEDNPIVTDRSTVVRPAGRPIVRDDHVLAFFQDCKRQYGDAVRAFSIDELTPTTYRDEEHPASPVLRGRGLRGWNSGRMHHVDPRLTSDGWLCAVDGDIGIGRRITGESWSIGIADGRSTP